MVLRLAMYLVEAGFYDSVEIAFFIVGHTKNPCDRCFNTLKKHYRKMDVYTMKQLLIVLNLEKGVSVFSSEDHRDWDTLLDVLYRRMPAGSVKKNHNFTVTSNNPTSITIQRSTFHADQQYTKTHDLKSPELLPEPRRAWLKSTPKPLPRPGLKKIKQVELVSKWKQYIPEEYWPDILPDVGEDEAKDFNRERYKKKRKIEETGTAESEEENEKAREMLLRQENRERIERAIAREERAIEQEASRNHRNDTANLQALEEEDI